MLIVFIFVGTITDGEINCWITTHTVQLKLLNSALERINLSRSFQCWSILQENALFDQEPFKVRTTQLRAKEQKSQNARQDQTSFIFINHIAKMKY